ncbi:hypothetical protein MLD38_007529 [Melastoma candidum]|uniref:Uncharacterized protein n=2 Tax=Melastoma candidum TaxID=119954 RepID=A0ACB9RRD5_9MYRT|nr:hypothetical protein MLD38_007529 [Melastoma candidum]
MPLLSTLPLLFFFFFLVLYSAQPSPSHVDPQFLNCTTPSACGPLNITYPFYVLGSHPEYCGFPGFAISCKGNLPYLNFSAAGNGHDVYLVHDIFYANRSILLSSRSLSDSAFSPCVSENVSLPPTQIFSLARNATTYLVLLHNCTLPSRLENRSRLLQHEVNCSARNAEAGMALAFYKDEDTESLAEASSMCMYSVELPVQSYWNGSRDIEAAVRGGFLMDWTASDCSECESSGGLCGFNFTSLHFWCYCPDRPHALRCLAAGTTYDKFNPRIGLGGLVILVFMATYLIVCFRGPFTFSKLYLRKKSDKFQQMDEEWGDVHLEIPIFTVFELEEATEFFDSGRELGDGGFGTVYYGKLRDGREVAVKRLYEHNYKHMKQFMTEVKILTRLRHRNLVSLYGCSPRKSRELLLVYEYVPNGTVADHLHGDRSKKGSLPWHIRISIAVETAQALAYLHASEIVHRDVKTDNILLDNNFEVKVADFGLSRLFPSDVSHVSTAPQGTPGYVDPEYYQCYQLTEKSDVYSFGVVLVELLSSMPAVDISRDRHEINLSSFATSKIQKRALGELVDANLGFGSDPDISRMVVLAAELAFRCLQQEKELRPTMEDIVEELEAIASGSAIKGSFQKVKDADENPSSDPEPGSNPSPVSVFEVRSSGGGSSGGSGTSNL